MVNILLVEDDENLRNSIAALLELHGHVVRAESNGCDALVALEAWRPDLVISDFDMPRMDGSELLRRIRLSPKIANVIFVGMSALKDRPWGDIDAFFPKPVPPAALLQLVERMGMKHFPLNHSVHFRTNFTSLDQVVRNCEPLI